MVDEALGLAGAGVRASRAVRAAAGPGSDVVDTVGSGSVKRLGAIGLLVVAASAVVAIGASGVGLLLPPVRLDGGWVLAVRIAGAAAVVAGFAGLLVQRKRLRSNEDRRYDPTAAALVAAATIMGVLALMARLAPSASFEEDPTREDSAATRVAEVNDEASARTGPPRPYGGISGGFGMARESPDRRITRPADDQGVDDDAGGFDRNILQRARSVLLLVLLFAVAVACVLALKGRLARRRKQLPPDMQVAAADAEAGLQASLVEVAHEGQDPRHRITAAYQRLLTALDAAGAPRRPQEAPHEHLHRTLGPLGVHPAPMHRLTELYVVAQFTERPITERHRAAATEALQAGLVDLRATTGPSETDGTEQKIEG